MYYSHNNNIKCACSIIKCIDFEFIHYASNLDIVLSFMIFRDFDYMFLSMYCQFESMKLFFFFKKNIKIILKTYLKY